MFWPRDHGPEPLSVPGDGTQHMLHLAGESNTSDAQQDSVSGSNEALQPPSGAWECPLFARKSAADTEAGGEAAAGAASSGLMSFKGNWALSMCHGHGTLRWPQTVHG